MPTGDIVTGSDGRLVIRIGPWAKDKLFYVKGICEIFNTGMKNKWAIRAYVDLFAGPGSCVVGETSEEIPGSPIVALRCRLPFTHYFFNDLKPELIESLRSRTSSGESAIVRYFSEDCNAAADEIRERLPDKSLDLCFIDPLNWEIKFDTIRRLTQNRNMDLLITFHIGSIKRDAANPPQALLDFFPDSSWQQSYSDTANRGERTGRVLLDSYEQGLKDLGYKEIRDHVLERNVRNVPLYYLIFASKHPRGTDFWDKVTTRSEAGQWRMAIA